MNNQMTEPVATQTLSPGNADPAYSPWFTGGILPQQQVMPSGKILAIGSPEGQGALPSDHDWESARLWERGVVLGDRSGWARGAKGQPV